MYAGAVTCLFACLVKECKDSNTILNRGITILLELGGEPNNIMIIIAFNFACRHDMLTHAHANKFTLL